MLPSPSISILSNGTRRLLPLLIAGLLERTAWVNVIPPLFCSGPSLGFGLTRSVPVPTLPLAPLKLPMRLLLSPLMGPYKSGFKVLLVTLLFGVSKLPAIIVFLALTTPLALLLSPPLISL